MVWSFAGRSFGFSSVLLTFTVYRYESARSFISSSVGRVSPPVDPVPLDRSLSPSLWISNTAGGRPDTFDPERYGRHTCGFDRGPPAFPSFAESAYVRANNPGRETGRRWSPRSISERRRISENHRSDDRTAVR